MTIAYLCLFSRTKFMLERSEIFLFFMFLSASLFQKHYFSLFLFPLPHKRCLAKMKLLRGEKNDLKVERKKMNNCSEIGVTKKKKKS